VVWGVAAGRSEERIGVAYVDVTTGEFAATELEGKDLEGTLRAELMRLGPAEVLLSEDLQLDHQLPGHLTRWPNWRFEAGRTSEVLLHHFKASTLDGFGLRGLPLAARAAGTILQYLE
jgi:DNA mismatch repair protein MutS